MNILTLDPGDRRGVNRFIDLPHRLYRENAYWVPEIRSSVRLVFDQKRHPFYRHSKAQFFLAEQGGEIVGRIAVLHNRNYSDHYKQDVGFFYYFDTIDEQAAADGLLRAAVAWARDQGITSILGPRGFLRSQGFGLLIEGFDQLPAVGIPYNFPYYQTFLENFGFVKEADLLSGYMVPADELPEKVFSAADRVAARGNFKVIQFQKKSELKPWIPMVDFVYRNAFLENPNYYPTTPEEFTLMARNIYQIANPRLVKIITRDGNIAGFLLGYPNINRALQKTRGRMFPFGWITLLNAMRDTRHVDLNGLGLLPEYQGRGANMLLYAEVERTLRAVNAQFAEMIQVDERNFASLSDFFNAGVHLFKRHRLYRLTL